MEYFFRQVVKDMCKHLCNLLGMHLPRVVAKKVEEVVKGEKNVRKRTRRLVVNLLRKIRSRREDGVGEEEKLEFGGREGENIVWCWAKEIFNGSNLQTIVYVHRIYSDKIKRHAQECGGNGKPAHIRRRENASLHQ